MSSTHSNFEQNPAHAVKRAFLALLGDTYRQAHASAVLWIMLSVTVLGFLLCLSVSVKGFESAGSRQDHPEWLPKNVTASFRPNEMLLFGGGDGTAFTALGYTYLRDQFFRKEAERTGVRVAEGTLYIGFGMIEVQRSRDAGDAVRNLQVLLATTMAGIIGMVLAIIWTAGFLPTFLETSAAAVLLVKPTPRWVLLIGKYLGVVLFFGVQVLIFVVGLPRERGAGFGVND